MLPLLPVEVITPENVCLLFFLLRPACREHASDFDDLYSYIINNYVAQNARFQKQIWCVCGQAIRTNNAAESSHATLNTFVRVSGAVSLDVFLFAIERQMRNASREIQAGCPSHTRAIYARRNGLLATELSDLLVGKQGILKYLARCSEIVRVKNLNDIRRFMDRKGGEGDDPFDREWALRSREVLLRAATSLYETLCPTNPNPTASIVSTVASWTFQPVSFEGDSEECSTMTALFRWRLRLRGRVLMSSELACSDKIQAPTKSSGWGLKEHQDVTLYKEPRQHMKATVTDL